MNPLDFSSFFFQLPIYTPVKIDSANQNQFYDILSAAYDRDSEVFNGYNPMRKSESSFAVNSFRSRHGDPTMYSHYGGPAQITVRCKRWDDLMEFFIYYNQETGILMKVGQYPSIADFHIHEVKQYNKVLSKEKLREFTRAIGLAANGVGIGSFVYLRRIFEGLIEEAHTAARTDAGWNEELFTRGRMTDKIQLLEAHLPPFLVENRALYGILSTGVHSLTEDDCLAHFDTVRVGIELILDEKLEASERKRKVEEAKQKLAALSSKLKGGKE
jgi:hypothetical protein